MPKYKQSQLLLPVALSMTDWAKLLQHKKTRGVMREIREQLYEHIPNKGISLEYRGYSPDMLILEEVLSRMRNRR